MESAAEVLKETYKVKNIVGVTLLGAIRNLCSLISSIFNPIRDFVNKATFFLILRMSDTKHIKGLFA